MLVRRSLAIVSLASGICSTGEVEAGCFGRRNCNQSCPVVGCPVVCPSTYSNSYIATPSIPVVHDCVIQSSPICGVVGTTIPMQSSDGEWRTVMEERTMTVRLPDGRMETRTEQVPRSQFVPNSQIVQEQRATIAQQQSQMQSQSGEINALRAQFSAGIADVNTKILQLNEQKASKVEVQQSVGNLNTQKADKQEVEKALEQKADKPLNKPKAATDSQSDKAAPSSNTTKP